MGFSKKYQRTMLSIHFSSNNVCEFGFKEYRRFSDFNFISDGRNVFLFLAFEIHYQLANWKRCWISNKRIPPLLHLAGFINWSLVYALLFLHMFLQDLSYVYACGGGFWAFNFLNMSIIKIRMVQKGHF